MSTQPYELELVAATDSLDYRACFMATLTGLPKEEVAERLPQLINMNSWGGRHFVEAAGLLGYNTNPRFVKFAPETPWPCVLRVQVPDAWGWKGKWWALIYNQGRVYNVSGFNDEWHECSFANFKTAYQDCRITSMLQVWISDL